MPDVEVTCGACKGARFNGETLEVTLRGKTIDDVLNMSVEEGVTFFADEPAVGKKIEVLERPGARLPDARPVGDDALRRRGAADQDRDRAEQAAAVEAHRLHPRRADDRACTWRTSSGCWSRLNRLVDAGHTVLLIEHHLDVIKTADHVIDLGPEGGHAGGEVVVTGTPEEVAACKASHTGRFLKAHLRG